MSRVLVVGNPVVTLADQAYIDDGALIVEGATIVESGPRAELENKGPFDRVLGSQDHFVMPGFIASHYHSESALGPGLWEMLFERANIYVHPVFKPMDEEIMYKAILVTLMTAIRGGITTTVDAFYGRPGPKNFGIDNALRAYEDLGMRTALGITLRDDNLYVHEPNEDFLKRLPADLAEEVRGSPMGYALPVDDVLAAYADAVGTWDRRDDRIRVLLAPDWTPAVSNGLYQRCRSIATECDTGIMTHALETRSEMQFNIRRYGVTAMQRLHDIGLLGPDVSLSHFVWATDRDIEILADSGAVAASNPGSNLRLSTGVCRVRDILAAGGRLAFGTDAISFSDKDDMLQEVRLASYLQRLPLGAEPEFGRLDSETLLRAAAENGARAARAEDRIGSLAVGKDADLLIMDRKRVFESPARFGISPVLDVILDRADGTDIESVMIAGKLVLDQGTITTVDEQKIRDEYNEEIEKGLFELGGPWARWAELSFEVEPYLFDFYRPWADESVAAGYQYNTTTGPLGFSGGSRLAQGDDL
jgi:5-methylthioadenosine/S-adenosylhomocysteine deaminase